MKLSPIWLAPAAALVLGLGLSACNTIEGMGEDVSAVGGGMSDASRDVRKDDTKQPTKQQSQQTARSSTD